jgi:ADP-dependent NAD(P)H-hydrate dehydratase
MSAASSATKRPRTITPALLRGWPLPAPEGERGKEDRGRVLVVGGSRRVPGAAVLAGVAALRAGAGTLQIATSASVAPSVAVAIPEAYVVGLREDRHGEIARRAGRALRDELARCDAVVLGPGMREARGAIDVLEQRASRDRACTYVIDAGALEAVGRPSRMERAAPRALILTPHAGEMAKLCGLSREEVLARPLEIAREIARELDATIVLKGSETFVVAPDGTALRSTAGNIGLGTSGSGDVLAGVIAGLAARGASPLGAAAWGVFLHGRAGDVLARRIGPLGYLAREIAAEIPAMLREVGRTRAR